MNVEQYGRYFTESDLESDFLSVVVEDLLPVKEREKFGNTIEWD